MEYFEVFAANGACLGEAPRHEVHRLGLWHRSVHAFVFDGLGRMLLQQRAPDKDLYANCWDYAVGEHLRAGESWLRGMRRGLQEELGLTNVDPLPLGDLHAGALRWPGGVDSEIQQAFVALHDGPVYADPVEVAEVRLMTREELQEMLERDPESLTPWFRLELVRLRVFSEWHHLVKALS